MPSVWHAALAWHIASPGRRGAYVPLRDLHTSTAQTLKDRRGIYWQHTHRPFRRFNVALAPCENKLLGQIGQQSRECIEVATTRKDVVLRGADGAGMHELCLELREQFGIQAINPRVDFCGTCRHHLEYGRCGCVMLGQRG